MPGNPDDPFGPPVQNVSVNDFSEVLSLMNTGKQQYNNLPAHIAEQLAALPPLPVLRERGRGRGLHPQPAPVSNVLGHFLFDCLY